MLPVVLMGVQTMFWALMAMVALLPISTGAINLLMGESQWHWALIAGPLLFVLPGFLPQD